MAARLLADVPGLLPGGLYDPEVPSADDTDSEAQLRKQQQQKEPLLLPPPPGERKALRAQPEPALGERLEQQ